MGPRSGDRLEFPDGSVLTVTQPAARGDEDELLIRFRVPPGGMPTAPHLHPRQTETYAVERGELEVFVGDTWHRLAAGDSATVPAGTPHAFRNRSDETAIFLNTHAPGLRFEEYIRAVHRLAERGKLSGRPGPRGVLYACALMREYGETIQAASASQRAAVAALSAAARLLRVRVR